MRHLAAWQETLRRSGQDAGFAPQVDRFLFLRHGETDHNHNGILQGWMDAPLNERGEEQAELAAGRLLREGLTGITTSSLGRAWRTADMVSLITGCPVDRVDARLRERGIGQYENQRKPESGTIWAREDNGAEPLDAFARRTIAGLNDALTHGCPLVVAHGGTRNVLLLTLELDVPENVKNNAIPLEFMRFRDRWRVTALELPATDQAAGATRGPPPAA